MEYWNGGILGQKTHSSIRLVQFVIPALTRNPAFDLLDSCFCRNDFFLRLESLCVKNQHSIIPTFHRSSSLFDKTHLCIDLAIG